MEFRRASAKDGIGISTIEQTCFSDPWSYRSIEDLLCTEGSMCFVAVEDPNTERERVVAYFIGRLIPPEGELYRIAVAPEYRKRGIGYRLMDYSVKTSLGRGLETLFLEVRSRNLAARRLYTSYGFREMGIRRGYYHDPEDDAVIMMHTRYGV